MIKVASKTHETCPCGCGELVPYFKGSIEAAGAFAFFYAYHLDDGNGPNLWLMIHVGSWLGQDQECAIVVQSRRDAGGVQSMLRDGINSPFHRHSDKVHFLPRETILANDRACDWVFAMLEHFFQKHTETNEFLGVGA